MHGHKYIILIWIKANCLIESWSTPNCKHFIPFSYDFSQLLINMEILYIDQVNVQSINFYDIRFRNFFARKM